MGATLDIHPSITGVDVSGLGGIWVYVVRGEKTALIDTGPKQRLPMMPESELPMAHLPPVVQVLPEALGDMGMTVADIDLILNTHIHFDHNGGNAAIKDASGATISIHEVEAGYFDDPGALFEHEQAPIRRLMTGTEDLEEEKREYIEGPIGPGPYAAVDKTLTDGDVIDLGGGCELEVVHLPGHSQGSVGFYWEKEGVLLSGDSLPGVGGNIHGLPILDEPAAYELSLERAQTLPLEMLVNGHPFSGLTVAGGAVIKGSDIGTYLEESLEFMQMLRAAADDVAGDLGKRPFGELYDEVIDKLPASIGLRKWDPGAVPYFSPATLLHCIQES
jgi:glyoxylase-like metal-dependent hydrolase (beta-lactamase superfamily II)